MRDTLWTHPRRMADVRHDLHISCDWLICCSEYPSQGAFDCYRSERVEIIYEKCSHELSFNKK